MQTFREVFSLFMKMGGASNLTFLVPGTKKAGFGILRQN
jgi:hypothetical protein